MPEIYLSNKARAGLRLAGIPATVNIRICSLCKKSSDEIPQDKVHPFHQKVIEARRQLELNRENFALQNQLHRFVSIEHNTSRCCGRRWSGHDKDNHIDLWIRWVNRFELLNEPLALIRKKYYGGTRSSHSDDFIAMSSILGVSDHAVRSIIKVFVKEDDFQKQVEVENIGSLVIETQPTQIVVQP